MKRGNATHSTYRGNAPDGHVDKRPIEFEADSFITAEKGGVARAKGEGEKEKEITAEGKSGRRRDEKAPWALNIGSGEGGGVEKGRRRGSEMRAMHV